MGTRGHKRESLKLLCICLALIAGVVPYTYGIDKTEPLAQPFLPEVRAMGGAFTAIANDECSVFYNPAGYGKIKEPVISIFSLGAKINIDSSALEVYNAIISGKNITSSSNIIEYLSDTTLSPGISGPVYFGRVGKNSGFAFYNTTNILLNTRPGAMFPVAEFYSYADLGFLGGFGTELPFLNNLYGGFNFKVVLRVKSKLEGTVVSVIDTLEESEGIPIAKSVGFGGDGGLLYTPLDYLSLGITFRDFFGTRFNTWNNLSGSENFPKSMIKPRIALGIAVFPLKTMEASQNSKDLVITADYSDLLGSSILANIKFGVKYTSSRFLDIYGGFDGGYLAGGVGFNIKIFHIGLYYYVDELGAYPGARPVQNLLFNLALKW
ncbi:MAG: hypothetical protein ACUVWJ_12520 [Spirochaetota bacterium]